MPVTEREFIADKTETTEESLYLGMLPSPLDVPKQHAGRPLFGLLLLSVAAIFFMLKIFLLFFHVLGTKKLGYRCNNFLHSFSLGPY